MINIILNDQAEGSPTKVKHYWGTSDC